PIEVPPQHAPGLPPPVEREMEAVRRLLAVGPLPAPPSEAADPDDALRLIEEGFPLARQRWLVARLRLQRLSQALEQSTHLQAESLSVASRHEDTIRWLPQQSQAAEARIVALEGELTDFHLRQMQADLEVAAQRQ